MTKPVVESWGGVKYEPQAVKKAVKYKDGSYELIFKSGASLKYDSPQENCFVNEFDTKEKRKRIYIGNATNINFKAGNKVPTAVVFDNSKGCSADLSGNGQSDLVVNMNSTDITVFHDANDYSIRDGEQIKMICKDDPWYKQLYQRIVPRDYLDPRDE